MKKLIYLLFFISTISYSQNAFMEFQFDAKRGTETAILALTDEFWGDAEFKSGGINIEAMNIGNENSTHRIVLFGDPANWGRSDSLSNSDKWSLFAQKLNNHLDKWTHSSSGNVISWVGSDSEDYSYVQIYEFKASDPDDFKSAHDKIVSQMSSVMGDRQIGFGDYLIGGYKGASHWVAITAKNWSDLIVTRRKMKELTKEWEQYYKNRGGVEHVRNYTANTVKRY
jgi:hypothetical protein|tara:strand:- start:48 stop:725 length:678 start_codon:yes stop_codon:yes gene_type:complete